MARCRIDPGSYRSRGYRGFLVGPASICENMIGRTIKLVYEVSFAHPPAHVRSRPSQKVAPEPKQFRSKTENAPKTRQPRKLPPGNEDWQQVCGCLCIEHCIAPGKIMFFGGDPFEHFAHHGGGSGRARRPAADVDTTKLYETLGVSFIVAFAVAAP